MDSTITIAAHCKAENKQNSKIYSMEKYNSLIRFILHGALECCHFAGRADICVMTLAQQLCTFEFQCQDLLDDGLPGQEAG